LQLVEHKNGTPAYLKQDFLQQGQTLTSLEQNNGCAIPGSVEVFDFPGRPIRQHVSIRILDILVATAIFVMALPIFIFVPLLIKLDSPGPVFYKQVRAGIDRRKRNRRNREKTVLSERRRQERRRGNLFGKPFFIYKFRTMEDGAERKSGPVWAMQNDPRITNTGKWLRRFHIDEIPQLLNVLKGDMSLVGPRPERPAIIADLVSKIPGYPKRLMAKPGLTGLAQICLGYDECLEDVRQKVNLDRYFISKIGLLLWGKILFFTAIKIFSDTPVKIDHFFDGQGPRKGNRIYEASQKSEHETVPR
jgi:lipopolysaccharide/colanic/teichoic acid biosynthesis glycosyltransferase